MARRITSPARPSIPDDRAKPAFAPCRRGFASGHRPRKGQVSPAMSTAPSVRTVLRTVEVVLFRRRSTGNRCRSQSAWRSFGIAIGSWVPPWLAWQICADRDQRFDRLQKMGARAFAKGGKCAFQELAAKNLAFFGHGGAAFVGKPHQSAATVARVAHARQ